jgi:hypothetical protein
MKALDIFIDIIKIPIPIPISVDSGRISVSNPLVLGKFSRLNLSTGSGYGCLKSSRRPL